MDCKGTIKIYDGIYVGDESSSRDEELILLNCISAVLNFTQLPNYFHHYGIQYMTIKWPIINFEQFMNKFTQKRSEGQLILLHGQNSLQQPIGATAIYLMQRFQWSLFKTLQFLDSRIPQLTFSGQTFEQLKKYEVFLLNSQKKLSYNWNQKPSDDQELIIRNTFLNSRQTQLSLIIAPSYPKSKKKKRISWIINRIQEQIQTELSNQAQKSHIIKQKILTNVRKILSNQQNKQVNKIQKAPSISEQNYPRLRKYKSTYTLASLSTMDQQKSIEIPLVSLELSSDRSKSEQSTNLSKRTKTQRSQRQTKQKNQKIIQDDNRISLKKIKSLQKQLKISSNLNHRKQQKYKKIR